MPIHFCGRAVGRGPGVLHKGAPSLETCFKERLCAPPDTRITGADFAAEFFIFAGPDSFERN